MAKEGASYLEHILATRDDLPDEDRIRLERALEELRGEKQDTVKGRASISLDEAALLINEQIGIRLGDEILLADLRSGRATYPKTSVPEDALEFHGLVGSLPRNVKVTVSRSLQACLASGVDTVGKFRQISREGGARKIYNMAGQSADFLEMALDQPKPRDERS